ncbi:MAG: hypothetical protein NTW87_07920 [Planctomycetota bacterium]|nr:hypothetical protein [Planctomycetota bacterium]
MKNGVANAMPDALEVRTVERWVVCVVRADGETVEVLSQLYHTREEAEFAASFHRRDFRGVTVRAAQCVVSIVLPAPAATGAVPDAGSLQPVQAAPAVQEPTFRGDPGNPWQEPH